MNAPPAKIKAFLATVKGHLDQPESLTFTDGLLLLLKLELVQRGVLVESTSDHVEKLFATIQSTAGRILLGTKNELPNPMLAGSAAMQGMMAKLCWDKLRQEGTPIQDGPPTIPNDLVQSGLKRCRDVQDDRFLCLLQLLNEQGSRQVNLLLVVAEGSFLRAASFQPEAPPMWKGAWDSVTLRQISLDCPVLEATYPLSQLYRIAISKDNRKRASELSLSFAESWLADQAPTDDVVKSFDAAFCSAYRIEDAALLPAQERVQRAEQSLIQVEDANALAGDELLRYKILNVRVGEALERVRIQTIAAEEMKLARNRSGVGLEKQESESSFVNRARDKVLVEGWKKGNLDADKHAEDLCDTVLVRIVENVPSSVWFESALHSVRKHIEGRITRARAVAFDSKKTRQDVLSAWLSVTTYVLPILKVMQRVRDEDSSASSDQRQAHLTGYVAGLSIISRRLVEEAAAAMVSATWMGCSLFAAKDIEQLLSCMNVIPDILSAVTEIDYSTPVKNSENLIRSTEDATKQKLALTSSSALALASLNSLSDGNPAIFRITEQVMRTSDSNQNVNQCQSDFGTAFLQLLVAWSGLRQGGAWRFCNLTQARGIIRLATEALTNARRDWGRETSQIENLLLTLSKADAEGGRLVGGFPREALELYTQTLSVMSQAASTEFEQAIEALIKSHCFCSLGWLALQGFVEIAASDSGNVGSLPDLADGYAKQALATLETVANTDELPPIYLWNSAVTKESVGFCTSAARQLVADASLRANRPETARQFLEDAVRDAPADFDAAFALGTFRLRTTLYAGTADDATSATARKQAQVQLLKAAKLNSNKAGPFALLGLWYEEGNDVSRALGCYSKALLLDPAHPVAGRGLLRLQPFEKVENMIETATQANSPLSGWAWRCIGQHKAKTVGNDDLAVIAFLKALRCRDVEAPEEDSLGTFFSKPSPQSLPREFGCVWAELAACYRRLGRYTSAIRAYQAAYDSAGEDISSWTLCSWAQVELELGLLDGAEKKFSKVLAREDSVDFREIAAYGQGLALLSMSNRQLQDGKLGVAFETLLTATSSIMETWQLDGNDTMTWSDFKRGRDGCAMKLLGDLFSLGSAMPSYVFGTDENVDRQQLLQAQHDFVRKGEVAYRAAEKAHQEIPLYHSDDEAEKQLLSLIICDIGANILLQAQLLCQMHEDGTMSLDELFESVPAIRERYKLAADEFRRSLQRFALSAPAWCGLGCAVAGSDPLLAQHAFCRALQLDRLFADAYSNLAFLYTSHNAFSASTSILDGLTQVADTPMMWVNRALILERTISLDDNLASQKDAAEKIAQASDAYRAAIQVMKHPVAMFGLSLSCRMSSGGETARVESRCYMAEFISAKGSVDMACQVMSGLTVIEGRLYPKGMDTLPATGRPNPWDDEVKSLKKALTAMKGSSVTSSLNATLIQKSLDVLVAAGMQNQADQDSTSSTTKPELSLVRKIVHQPDRGDLWLDLAKHLSRQRLDAPAALRVAQEAAARAEQLLTQQLVQSRNRRLPASKSTSSSEVVASKSVSDALALSYWLSTQGSWHVQNVQPTSYDLQRALMMCPNSALARAALPAGL